MKKPIELKPNDVISYKDITANLGRAEFFIEPVFKRGKIVECYITRLQQENHGQTFVIRNIKCNGLYPSSWTHKGYDDPKTWRIQYCADHKTVAFSSYVPRGTNQLLIDVGSDLRLIFECKGDSE